MEKFLGKLSIADAMGDLYGEKVKIIAAIASVIGAAGRIAIQFKVTGSLFEYCFNVDGLYGVIIGAFIVTTYSTLGGIKSVTFTDVVQFITFGTIVPITAFFMLNEMSSLYVVVDTLNNHPTFNYQEVFDFTRPKSFYYLFLFLYMIAPSFDPPMFQRISMARNVLQVQKAFVISGLVYLCLGLILAWTAILVLSTNPNLVPKDITKHILFNYSYIGLKGLTLAGIMAMVMSTADSYINCAAVTFIHDFCKPLRLNLSKNDLTSSRFASFLIGIFALIIALKGQSLLKTLIACNSFYMPLVSVPFTLAVFGFSSSTKSVLIGMVAGFSTVIFWYIANISFIDPIVPGMLANLVFLLGSHYLLKQQGGWDKNTTLSRGKKNWFQKPNFIGFMRSFNLISLIKKSSPTTSAPYIAVGFFCMSMTYATMHSIPREISLAYPELVKFVTFSSLFAATALLGHPLWLPSWREKTLIAGIIWNFVIFSVLICAAFTFVIITNFSSMQVMIFMINLIIIAGLLRWQLALLAIPLGIFLTLQLLKNYIGIEDNIIAMSMSAQLKIAYLLLLVSSVVVIVFRPKQEHQELTEEKNEHLSGRLSLKDKEVQEALAIKAEFLRNIPHEYHAAMTGVISTSETLRDAYDKLSDKQKRMAIDNIFTSSISLKSFDDNITTLARLSKPDYELNKEDVDFSALVHDRVQTCRKYYEETMEDREFILNIKDNIIVNADKSYMIHLLDNLIINAIKYCKKGKISIILRKSKDRVDFVIADEGIGIPKTELYDVFEPFTVSSKTRTTAGGRGIGLAVCKRIVEAHGGTISANSNDEIGAILKFILPSGNTNK
jgi:Na+/proline symporter/two-component sensor histidine kinase